MAVFKLIGLTQLSETEETSTLENVRIANLFSFSKSALMRNEVYKTASASGKELHKYPTVLTLCS